MKLRTMAAFLVGGNLLFLPSPGWSQGAACESGTFVPADGRINGGSAIAAGDFFFQVPTTIGNSYSFEAVDTVDGLGSIAESLSLAVFADTTCGTPVTSKDTRGGAPGVGPFNARVSWIATKETSVVMLTVPAGPALTSVTWTANDTTLYSTAWSTNGTYNTYYSLKNTTDLSISGTLTLFNVGGTPVTTAPLTIVPAATAATNTVALGTVRNTTGTAMFVHNGPPGAILAEATIANFSILPTPYNQPVKFQTVREIR